MRRPLAALGLALTFLTVLPVRLRGEPAPLGSAAGWFGVVGAGVGAVAGLVAYLARPSLGPLVAAVLALVVLVALTGALHEDGLADCADGLGARGGGRERRLEVMRDPAVGVFGALALVLWSLLLTAALAGIDRGDALRALVVACCIGRVAAVAHAVATPPARDDGLGAGFAVPDAALAAALATAILVALLVAGLAPGAAALAGGAVVAALVSVWSRRMLGGRTGDTLGATVALTEAAVAVVLLGTL